MRTAYTLLGIAFIIVFLAAYIFIERAHAPETPDDVDNTYDE